jgi:hypothetical protein
VRVWMTVHGQDVIRGKSEICRLVPGHARPIEDTRKAEQSSS